MFRFRPCVNDVFFPSCIQFFPVFLAFDLPRSIARTHLSGHYWRHLWQHSLSGPSRSTSSWIGIICSNFASRVRADQGSKAPRNTVNFSPIWCSWITISMPSRCEFLWARSSTSDDAVPIVMAWAMRASQCLLGRLDKYAEIADDITRCAKKNDPCLWLCAFPLMKNLENKQ